MSSFNTIVIFNSLRFRSSWCSLFQCMANAEFVRREKILELGLSLGMEVFSVNFSFKETISEIYGRDKETWLIP